MDPVAVGVGFLLGIVGAGFGVVLEQVIVGHFRDRRLRRALFAEIRDSMALLFRPNPSQLGLLQRSAWDEARGLDWTEDLSRLLRAAYQGAERYNRQVSMIELKEGGLAGHPVSGVSTDYDRKAAIELASEVYVFFDRVRVALAKQLGLSEPEHWEP